MFDASATALKPVMAPEMPTVVIRVTEEAWSTPAVNVPLGSIRSPTKKSAKASGAPVRLRNSVPALVRTSMPRIVMVRAALSIALMAPSCSNPHPVPAGSASSSSFTLRARREPSPWMQPSASANTPGWNAAKVVGWMLSSK